jgi:hypothetical protein
MFVGRSLRAWESDQSACQDCTCTNFGFRFTTDSVGKLYRRSSLLKVAGIPRLLTTLAAVV